MRSMIYRVPVDDLSTLLYLMRFYPSEREGVVADEPAPESSPGPVPDPVVP